MPAQALTKTEPMSFGMQIGNDIRGMHTVGNTQSLNG